MIGNSNMCDMGYRNYLHMDYGKAETQKHLVSCLGLGNWNSFNI